MLNNKNNILRDLYKLGLSFDEGKIYLALLEEPMTHLELARKTGVNRTKVYRLAESLMKYGLITENQDDGGKQLAANAPTNLELSIRADEEKVETKKSSLKQALPLLQELFDNGARPQEDDFIVNTYEGIDGFKQMLWNELKTQGEILIFGSGTIEDLVGSRRWAENHRQRTVEQGYSARELLNLAGEKPNKFTMNKIFMDSHYQRRYIDTDKLPLGHQLSLYNNTAALYNWRNGQKVGTEIINKSFVDMQRAIFEAYWSQGKQLD